MRCVTKKSARDVDRGDKNRQRTQHRCGTTADTDLNHAADDDDAADRVGDTHQRRVQRGRDIPNHLPSDDAGQDKDGKVGDESSVLRQADPTNRTSRDQRSASMSNTPIVFLRDHDRGMELRQSLASVRPTPTTGGGGQVISPSLTTVALANHDILHVDVEVLAPPNSSSK